METIEKTERKGLNVYKTVENDPQYFGGYLNMARSNIFSINNSVAHKIKISTIPDEEKILDSFLCNNNRKHLNWNLAHSIAVKFLPIIKVFDFESLPKSERTGDLNNLNTGKDFAAMAASLRSLFREIQEFRNDYSHYYSIANGNKRKMIISGELAEFLRLNFARAIEYTKERFNGVLNDDDFEPVKERVLVNQDNTITTDGFVFLISMFLEREYAFQFIGKIKGLKGTQFNSFIATREVLMAFCAKLPHDRFVSEDKKQAFTLDIINTLNRCPKELYGVITDEERKAFKPCLDKIKLENLLDNSTNDKADVEDYDKYIEALTRKIRHSNRFSYFALKFIDETDIFSKLRFQINLGKLLIDEYEKPINSEMYPRSIVQDVKAFGKLSDFEDGAEVLKQINKDENSLGFEQYAPFYNTKNNKIGLHTNSAKSIIINRPNSESKIKKSLKQALPEAFLSLHELPKIIVLEHLEKGKSEELINDFILACNSKITNKQFIDEVKGKLPNDWNEFGKRSDSKTEPAYKPNALAYLRNRKKIVDEVLAPYNLNHKQIPTRILDYWLCIVDISADRAISDRIKRMKREGMDRLKAYQKFTKTGKGKIPKIGEMATFLAKDIVDMVISTDKKKKITSFYYDKMQECLALFADPEKKSLFIDLISKELHLNEADGHPFLKNIEFSKIRYTQDLYLIYLQEKVNKMIDVKNFRSGKTSTIDKSWMMCTFYKREWNQEAGKQLTEVKLPDNLSSIPFTLRQLKEKISSNMDEWLHNLTKGKEANDGKMPINLPTNLFDETLIRLLQNDLDAQQVEYSADAKYNELFKIWWRNRGDSTQSFYHAEREYFIFDEKVNFKLQENAMFADFYSLSVKKAFRAKQNARRREQKTERRLPDIQFSQVEKVFKRSISNTEKQIRLLQEEDQILLLMLEKLIGFDQDLNLKLNQIDILLNETITVKESVRGNLFFDNNAEITRRIIDQRKRKDHSMLHKYVFDRRLPELFEYFTEKEIPLPDLKNELEAYNNAKQRVLDAAFELEERLIANNAADDFMDADSKTRHIPHKAYLQWLKKEGMINENEFQFLNRVRNCFSHNQFPPKSTMSLFVSQWADGNFALQIAELYNEKIKAILEK
ncbi:MAG: type VI-B CRISPR-associated RNA-guided ribonuclease Cas13b [Labilibaculum antarcticum]